MALVDDSHPREKPCGGGVTGRALDEVGDSLDRAALPAVSIEAATFEYGGERAAMPLRDGNAEGRLLIVARRDFDAALLDIRAWCHTRRRLERTREVIRAERRSGSKIVEVNGTAEICLHEQLHATKRGR